MKIIRKSNRPIDQNSWRRAWHEYYPGMTNFGQITGFNLDVVKGGKGFPMHPHRDMEIITIPTDGQQIHTDSLGNQRTIGANEVQVMSAGKGIRHSEMNNSNSASFTSYQIWVYPEENGLNPSYQQKKFEVQPNEWQLMISPVGEKGDLNIHQKAWFSRLITDKKMETAYVAKNQDHKIYLQIVKGEVEVNGHKMFVENSAEINGERCGLKN